MDFEQHLQKLIAERNKREGNFRNIIKDNNTLYQELKKLKQQNLELQTKVESLDTKLFNLEEMTKVSFDKGTTVVNDNYF